jgi:extracellular elastinolytic metalloproteinase
MPPRLPHGHSHRALADEAHSADGSSSFIRRALAYALNAPRGLTDAEAARVEYVPSGGVQQLSSGMRVVHLRQHHLGVPLLDSGRSVRFDERGAFLTVTGRPAAVAPGDDAVIPRINAVEATYAACRHLADSVLREHVGAHLDVSNRRPRIVAEFGDPSRPTVLRKPPFRDPIVARLVILGDPGDSGDSKLAWEVRLALPHALGAYAVFVDAGARGRPRILETSRFSAHAAASGRVFEFNPVEQGDRVTRSFPLSREHYPAFSGRSLPSSAWVEADATSGDNASCVDAGGRPVRAAITNGSIVFEPGDSLGSAQVNAFYLVNFLHDFFLLLGFDEATGNFQKVSAAAAGGAGDPVKVALFEHPVPGHAFFVSRRDGQPPELVLGPLGARHTALDADIVIHEYCHGVTNRVIGGLAAEFPLRKPQSRALGEGFSDYFAISIQNYYRRREGRAPRDVFGAWVSGDKPAGLRNHAYGPGFPGTYGRLGKKGFEKDHDAGTVWCQALLEMNAALAAGGDPALGDELGWQIVFDSLRLLHPGEQGPTFLHARDAVLSALARLDPGALTAPADQLDRSVRAAFARLGMGPAAKSDSAGFGKIREDFGGT